MSSASSSKPPQLRRDPIFNRWVIISPTRSNRPFDFKSPKDRSPENAKKSCPFCIGHEYECAPEIFRIPPGSDDWKVRVIQNLYPALKREKEVFVEFEGLGFGEGVMAGFGFHDVVIECPQHDVGLVDMDDEEIGEVILAYKKRVLSLKQIEPIKYVQEMPKDEYMLPQPPLLERHLFLVQHSQDLGEHLYFGLELPVEHEDRRSGKGVITITLVATT